MNSYHIHYKVSSTEVLDVRNFGCNLSFYTEMAVITQANFDQYYSKYIFSTNITQNLQLITNNENNIRYYWIKFISPLLFLCEQLYSSRSKVLIIICSLLGLSIAFYMFKVVSQSKIIFTMNLRDRPKNYFFIIEILHITHELNEFLTDMDLKLFNISKMKNKNNVLYLIMLLILSGDINLNPGPVKRHQTKDEKFEVPNSKGLHFMHLNINSLPPKTNCATLLNAQTLQ